MQENPNTCVRDTHTFRLRALLLSGLITVSPKKLEAFFGIPNTLLLGIEAIEFPTSGLPLRVHVPHYYILGALKYFLYRDFGAQVYNNEVHGPLGYYRVQGWASGSSASAAH